MREEVDDALQHAERTEPRAEEASDERRQQHGTGGGGLHGFGSRPDAVERNLEVGLGGGKLFAQVSLVVVEVDAQRFLIFKRHGDGDDAVAGDGVVQAAALDVYELLAKDFKLPPVKIFLEKNTPVGAGLGGGSADAAFTLKALNELFGLGLKESEPSADGKPSLKEYAACLGSDCAFFIFNRPMIGTGRGDILRPLTSVAGQQITSGNIFEKLGLDLRVIVPEGISVSTVEAYKGIQPRETADGANRLLKGAEPLEMALMRPIEEWKDNIVNDFEVTVFKAHPELAAIKQSLYDAGAAYASMSGSGSALFALYRK